MKKIISLMLVAVMALSLTACNNTNKPSDGGFTASGVHKASDKVRPSGGKITRPSTDENRPSSKIPSKGENPSVGKIEKPSKDVPAKPSNEEPSGKHEMPSHNVKYDKLSYSIHTLKDAPYNFKINGQPRKLEFSHTYDENTYDYTLKFRYTNGDEISTTQNTDMGYFNSAYIITASDESSAYLYVVIGLDNDWTKLLAYNITNGVQQVADYWNMDIPFDVGSAETVDVNNFRLVSRINALGTYMCYRYYKIGNDGSLTPVDPSYIPYAADLPSHDVTIHNSQEVELYVKNADGSVDTSPTKYPINSEFKVVGTDEGTFVDLYVTSTQETGRLYVQKDDSGLFQINGVIDYEVFPDVPYAG